MCLYAFLSVQHTPWRDLSVDLVLALSKTARKHDSIFVVVDSFSKMAHFIPCSLSINVSHMVKLFFKEIVRLHDLPATIMSIGC